ncbi:MAG: selenocysteine-specific translation elongation factor [Bacteroidales bacterium]|nr:selenocysteine-specific translation elongation factor [Bacteroidales bacterium]
MKHLILGTAGHVDHGKTALIKALTGIDCDTHKEEKERGITINLGFAHLELSDEISIGVVDVPGHRDFIKTMVAGAYGIDFVLLVIAADSGIMPQTREHFNIIKMLGIRHGIVAINKADLVDDDTMELAKLEAMELLEGCPLENAPVVAVSSVTGSGIDDLRSELLKIAALIPEKSHVSNFRMYIDRIFNVRGIGIVVTGSVLEGEVSVGEELHLLPGGHGKLKVKSIERHGRQVEKVAAGDRAALNLSGLKYEDFERGMILSSKLLQETNLLDAQVELFPGNIRIGTWSHQIFHTGTFSSKARVHLITKNELLGAEKAVAQIHLEKPAILLANDRFILRNTSSDMTFGGGIILDPSPLHHRRRTEKLKNVLQNFAQIMTDQENLAGMIRFELQKSNTPLSIDQLASKSSKSESELLTIITANPGVAYGLHFEGKVFLADENHESNMVKAVLESLQHWHQQNPLNERGLEAHELAGKFNISSKGFDLFFLNQMLGKMVQTGKLKTVGATFALMDHKISFDRKAEEQLNRVEQIILVSGMVRSSLRELEAFAQQNQIRKSQLNSLLQHLVAKSRIYLIGDDVLHASIVDNARKLLLAKLSVSPRGINEKEFRTLIDGTKKGVQLLITLFLKEGIISKQTFYLLITEKGRVKSVNV